MTSLYSILAWYGLFMIATVLAQVFAARAQVGDMTLMGTREDMPKLTGLAGRLDRAQANNTVAMALFAPAVLMLANAPPASALLTAQVFLAARIGYVVAYAAGISVLRTLIWLVGFAATGWLYWQSI